MKAVILAAGYATKLHPLTTNQPKALLSIGHKTILGRIIDHVINTDINEIIIVTNNKFYKQFESWKKTYKPTKPIKIINDGTYSNEDRLGAVGDLNYVLNKERIEDDLLVIASDNVFEFSLKGLIQFFKSRNKSVVAVHAIDRQKIAEKYACIHFDENKKITLIEEKPKHPTSNFVSTGCYIFNKEDLTGIADYLRNSQKWDNLGDYLIWLKNRNELYAYLFTEPWFDIGSFQALEEAYKGYEK